MVANCQFEGSLKPNLDLLVNRGVPISCISKLMLTRLIVVMVSTTRSAEIVENVENLGILPRSPMFYHAFRVMSSVSKPRWESKAIFLKSLGWSEEEIMTLFKRLPICMSCSREKIQRVADFFVNNLKFDRSTLLKNPVLLTLGMEKRILPRHSVIQVLYSKRLLKRAKKMLWMFFLPEKKFVEKFVIPYVEEAPGFVEMYRGRIAVDKFHCKGEKAC